MAQLITVRLNKSDQQPLGFRLQGGKDFGTPLVVQKVNGGSAAERAGLQAGDALIRVNNTDVYALRHQEAQDAIRAAGIALELTVQRGGGTWKPSITSTGSLPRPGSRPLGSSPVPVTNTSLKATPQPTRAFGSGHNNVAKPFGYMNGNDSVKSIVNKQYNTPVNMYSDKTIAETLSAQTEVLAGGVLGVNFKKNEKSYDAEKSAVFKVLQEEQNDPEPVSEVSAGAPTPVTPVSGLRHVAAPVARPDAPLNTGGLPHGQNICEECERLITGVFVRIKDKNLHVECFKCATCGSALKNQGYYNLNGKLYCDIHAKLVARQNPPASNLEPVTVPPGSRIPSNAYSTPLPPLATNNYTNGSSSMFSPSSNLSGPKPFGSSIGSAYSPASLSPRSAPLSPARPLAAPAPASAPAPAHAHAPAPAFAPTNDATQSVNNQNRTEFKSPAEERLIRKMAKMALNGYEIGIQRKIKPADHIQSMADKIQDTIVTKHPLNADNIPSGESSRENTLKRPVHKNFDKTLLKTLENNIPSTSSGNFFLASQETNSKLKNGHAPEPPPLPTTPVPTFQSHSTPITNILNNIATKSLDFAKSNNHNTNDNLLMAIEKPLNGLYSNSEEIYIDKSECTNYANGLKKKTGYQEENPEVPNCSNTLNKRKLFERSDALNDSIYSENSCKFSESINNSVSRKDNVRKDKEFDNIDFAESCENVKSHKDEILKKLSNNLHDNTMYTYKSAQRSGDMKINSKNEIENGTDVTNGAHSSSDYDDKENSEIVVRRRDKKNIRNNDGRRDSHIIARPLSTMTSVDVSEGQYPICHKCDKAITRGPFITALGRIWCPEHFVCVNTTCRRQLQDIGFVEENGQLYCEYCFEQYIAPACNKCHAKIKGDCLNAIGKHFHPECFSCVYCGKLFGNNPFFLEDGLPYCEAGIGTSCSQRSASRADSRWRRATGGWRRSTITTTVSASTARCAKRISKDRVSSPGEDGLSARYTHARSPQRVMYNSDTVYTTTTFRPVSISPSTVPASTPSPQRTRKLETPLHFDGGLFSDIRSADGKLLSKVTVDRVHSSSRHDVTDSPHLYEDIDLNGNKEYIDEIVKTETITNEDVIKVKFTPVRPELDSISLWSQTQVPISFSPVPYIKNEFEDLYSYKIVNSVCKENLLKVNNFDSTDQIDEIKERQVLRGHSPLANLIIPEHLTKIDSYLQESLNVLKSETESDVVYEREVSDKCEIVRSDQQNTFKEFTSSYQKNDIKENIGGETLTNSNTDGEALNDKDKLNSVKKHPGVIKSICNLPMHYHAAILCFFLIVYNLFYQYYKQNCHGKTNL